MGAHLVTVVVGNTDIALFFSSVLVNTARAGLPSMRGFGICHPLLFIEPYFQSVTLIPVEYWIQIAQMLPVSILRASNHQAVTQEPHAVGTLERKLSR